MNTRKPRTMQGAYHPNCRCLRCYEGNAAWQRERRHGLADGTWQPLVDAEPARQHIERLHAQGMSYNAIARRAGLSVATLAFIRRGVKTRSRTERIYADNLTAILAVRADDDTRGLPARAVLDSRGSVRRLQALRAIGWPAERLAAYAGISRRTVTRASITTVLQAETHDRIRDVYDLLHDQDPMLLGATPVIVKRSKTLAHRNGWAPPTAWGDIDSDEQPARRRGKWSIHYATTTAEARHLAVIDATAELAAARETREQIAKRIGKTWDHIVQIHSRAKITVPDVAA